MPILSVEPSHVTTVCPICGAAQRNVIGSLTLGTDRDPNVILIPPCVCGARECLFRTWDSCPEQSTAFDLQRRAVNTLAQDLKGRGRSHAAHRAAHLKETMVPADLWRGDITVAGPIPLTAKAAQAVDRANGKA